MPTLQLYEGDKEARLFDGELAISFSQRNCKFHTGFSKAGITKILKRLGYGRLGDWKDTDWGYQATFIRF